MPKSKECCLSLYPMVVIKLVVNVSSENRRSKQLFPTPGNKKGTHIRLRGSCCNTQFDQNVLVNERNYRTVQHIDKDGIPSVCQSNTIVTAFTGFRLSKVQTNILLAQWIVPTPVREKIETWNSVHVCWE